jgi:methylated-DNA-protein-cysteine methyltransferase-like protein
LAADRARRGGDRRRGGTFEQRVLSVVRRIPVGRVTTYGLVAGLAGRPRAARAVGNIMRNSRHPGLPYHRVIAAGGRLGGYSNPAIKRALLSAEGLRVSPTRVLDFAAVCWPSGR